MKRKISPPGNTQKQKPGFLNILKQRIRLRQKVVLIAAGIFSLIIVTGLIIYFQFAKVEKAYANSAVTLAEFDFENNLNADAGAIGSPVLTYDNTLSYVSGGVSGNTFEFSHTESGAVFELTMSTLNYSNITIQWTGQATNPGHTSATVALTGNSGAGYGGTLYTYTFSSTSWTASSVIALGSAFNNNSQIKIKITYTTDGKNDDIDNLIVSGSSTLPIELLYFKPVPGNNRVDLTWATASEINNNYFTVERSPDGKDFEEILRKTGAGNSTEMLSYLAYDEHPLTGISHYRLKQTDYDGKFTYSPMQTIQYGVVKNNGNISIEAIGPDPFNDHFNINYTVAAPGNAELQILSSSGQLVYKETLHADMCFNSYSFHDNEGLPPGIYIVNIISEGEAVTKKIIKQ